MAILKEYIYQLLRDDATLHTLLSKAETPYGVYFMSPPAKPEFPLITYFVGPQSGRFPRDITINITAWGNNFEAVQNRIYELLHDVVPTGISDCTPKMLKWDWAAPELFDDDYKIYYRQDRYILKVLK